MEINPHLKLKGGSSMGEKNNNDIILDRKSNKDIIEIILKFVIVAMMCTMSTITFVQVVGRFVFNKGIVWAEELSVYSMFAMIYLTSVLLTKEDSHVSITLLETMVKGNGKKILKGVHYLIWIIYSVLIAVVGFITSKSVMKQISPNMRISMGLVYIFLPVSALLIGLYTIKNIKNIFYNKTK